MNQQTNQLSDDNDIEIVSSLVNGVEAVSRMEVDSTAKTQAPTQVLAPIIIDQKLDLLLSKMDKLDTMVNYSNAAIATLSKIVAKDKKRLVS